MRSVLRVFGASALTVLLAAACSGSSSDTDSNHGGSTGGASGTTSATGGASTGGGSGSSTGGTAGSATGGTAGSVTGGTAGSATGGDAGSAAGGKAGSATGGDAGSATGGKAGSATGGAAGSGGASGGGSGGGSGATGCSKDEDCIVASTYGNTGCCSRGCGVALNADYVANDPCASADLMTDPVPASCSAGCLQCPQDPRCERVHAAVCLAGTCTAVTDYGPCSVNEDCVPAIDYESTRGACCNCQIIASRTTIEHAECIVAASDPKPQGCEPSPANACATVSCPAMCTPPVNLRCEMGRCLGGVLM